MLQMRLAGAELGIISVVILTILYAFPYADIPSLSEA